jgi:hypothetical protein
MKLTDDPPSLERILRYIDSTIVVQNMLIELDDAANKNAAWYASVVTELTPIDDA